MQYRNVLLLSLSLIAIIAITQSEKSCATTRIKDIVMLEGARENIIVGYGLVAGLPGTGDNITNVQFTFNSIMDYLNKMGVNTNNILMNVLTTQDVAAVMVTATIPAFSKPGSKINVNVSALGNATSIRNGNLIATPMLGPDGTIYAFAQGKVTIPSMTGNTRGSSVQDNQTSGYIEGGAILEKSLNLNINKLDKITLSLYRPDTTTARGIASVINATMMDEVAKIYDPATVTIRIPSQYQNRTMDFLAEIETLPVSVDTSAKVVIDESTGTIVIGDNVTIDPVAISQGDIAIRIEDQTQPPAAAGIQRDETGRKLVQLDKSTTLRDLVNGLNTIGVKPKDMIVILRAMRTSGALHANIETN